MNTELQRKLLKKYPKIFSSDKKIYIGEKSMEEEVQTLINQKEIVEPIQFGIECGDGWYMLIDRLCSHLQWNTDNNNKDYVIKNKALRVLIPKLDKLIDIIPGKYSFKREWKGLLYGLRTKHLEYIYIESNRYPQVVATQVKEKFGGLCFYEYGCNKDYSAISFAESLSYHICEECGSTKNVGQTEGWVYTRCEECVKNEKVYNINTLPTWKSHEDRQKEKSNTEDDEN